MKNGQRTALALSVLAALLVAAAPASASSITLTLDPSNRSTRFSSVSTTDIVLTYPANSSLSGYLNGYNSSLSLSGTLARDSDQVRAIQSGMDERSPGVSIQNASVDYSYNGIANSTALVVQKETNITGWATGVFHVTNGTVTANLGWRSFSVPGSLDMDFGGRTVDINLLGASLTQPLAGRTLVVGLLSLLFANGPVWNRATIDFSNLSSPLSTWSQNYDQSTNTTTFTKTISVSSNFSAAASYNGQKYTLSAVSDPSASITVDGYAHPLSDSLVIESPPAPVTQIATVVVMLALLIAAVVLMAYRLWSKSGAETSSSAVKKPL